jgi:hypothetical protein
MIVGILVEPAFIGMKIHHEARTGALSYSSKYDFGLFSLCRA